MPYIIAYGTDMTKGIQTIHLTAKVDFSEECFKDKKYVNNKMNELYNKIENLIGEYITEFETEVMSNHEYNKNFNGLKL